MKLYFIVLLLILTGCSNASETDVVLQKKLICEFDFKSNTPCVFQNITVKLNKIPVAVDEISINSLEVTYQGKVHMLEITPDTTFLDGDKGYIFFDDINYDGTPDIAITTSFGVANLYMDYWVFDKKNNKYIRIGNFCKFTLNVSNKTLDNEIKINAAKYEKNTYFWKGNNLLKQQK